MIIRVSVKIWSDWVPIKFRKSKTPMDPMSAHLSRAILRCPARLASVADRLPLKAEPVVKSQ